jgi:hypothetical protein
MVDTSEIYRVNPAIAVEDFGERSLALHCEALHLVELNATARDLISRLDGQTPLTQVSAAMAADYDQPIEIISADIQVIIAQMVQLDVVAPVHSVSRPTEPTAVLERNSGYN